MRLLLLASFVIVISGSCLGQGHVAILVGGTCSGYLDAVKNGSESKDGTFYASAEHFLNMWDKDWEEKHEFTVAPQDPRYPKVKQITFLQNYCIEHKDKYFQSAAFALANDMREAVAHKQIP